MRTWLARTGLVLLFTSACFAAGCAQERDPIDRVQPNVLPKTFFLGQDLESASDDPEFRMKSFVADSSVNQSEYSIGEFSAVDRIRWEITEQMLLARRSYQESPGADDRATTLTNGTVVAAFKIDKHFDIRRDYNPSTGEETNIIVENDSDRPWFQRSYVRVDWSQNLVDSTDDSKKFFHSAKVTPVQYSISDPASDDAPHLEEENGYLDVTNKFTVEADDIQFPWGSIKKCQLVSYFTGTSSYDCNPQETTVRTSFARVGADEDFEKFEDDNAWQDVVGNTGGQGTGVSPWLGSARTTWDPQYGFNDAGTHRFKSIHNIWVKSHQAGSTCASNDDTDRDGTADACANALTGYTGHSGSQCDVTENRCTIPVRDRELRTIAYHLNPGAPDVFQDRVSADGAAITTPGTLEEMGHSWSQLLEVSVAYRREVECRRTFDGNRNDCHAQYFASDATPGAKQMVKLGNWLTDTPLPQAVDQGKPGFYLCHNPVRAYDPEAVCGKPGDRARLGDIRKNFLVYWPYESRGQYGGIGWNPSDPTTGETFGATATIMGRSVTRAAASERDIIQLALGDTKVEDILDGVPAVRYARTLKDGASAPEGLRIGKTDAEIAARVAGVDVNSLHSSIANRAIPAGTSAHDVALLETLSKAKSMVDADQYNAGISSFSALAGKLSGVPGMPANFASPISGMEPAKIAAMHQWYDADLAAKGACFDDAANSGSGTLYLASLAGFFRAKYGSLSVTDRGNAIYDDLVKETIHGIGTHELGHSLGLRHNFASSWDAPNFNPQYWQLRTNEGQSTAECKTSRTGNDDSCMGPRYLDPMTADEQGIGTESRPGLDYFANTSTMEYQIERGGESVGLGTYDQHAMKVLYGRVIETFDDRSIPTSDQPNFGLKNYTQLQERDIVIDGNTFFTHYTQTARLMKVFDAARDCRPATDDEKANSAWRLVHGKVCAPPPKDHWAWDDFKSDMHPAGLEAVKWHATFADGKDHVRWNYRWGEGYGAGGYMHTQMQDAGADVYELTQNLTRTFELRYPWTYFRRGDREWNAAFLSQAVASNYFGRLRAYHWQIALDASRGAPADLTNDNALRPYVMAQADIFAFLERSVLMPEPGTYTSSAPLTTGTHTVFDLVPPSGGGSGLGFTLGIGDGRYIGEDFENNKGGSWNYQQYVHHAGFEEEKALAMMQLVDPRPTLFTVARENFLDDRNVDISFRSDLPDGVDRLLGGVLSEDWESVAPHVMGDASSGLLGFDLTQKNITRPQGAMIVFPNIGYKQQLQMLIYGALFSRLGSDMTLLNKLRLSVDGDATPTIPGVKQVRFTDPQTGFSYLAGKYGDDMLDGVVVDHGVASRMVGRANQLLGLAYQLKKDPLTGKPVVDAQGQPVLDADAGGAPIPVSPEATLNLRRYVGLLDALRQVSKALDGPLGGGGGSGSSSDE